MAKVDYVRQVLALTDSDLELFVRDWVDSKKSAYVDVTRFAGAGDLGRDVVGFLTSYKHEGAWHNYQCKQYMKSLPTATAICEIGKILYYAFKGEFLVPTKYFFVAPRGVNRNLEKLIFNPSQFKDTLIDKWDEYCGESKIIDKTKISLEPALKAFIDSFDFSTISRINLDDMINDASVTPVLYKWFGADPGPSPKGDIPINIHTSELPYINQLVEAYGEREDTTFRSHEDIVNHIQFGEHLSRQRERFYDADVFKRYYRDNTAPSVIDDFEDDVFNGVIDKCNARHADALDRIDGVMSQAATIQPSGLLAQHARVSIKQGICHHFANDGRLKWKK